jgi:hypothetical protein
MPAPRPAADVITARIKNIKTEATKNASAFGAEAFSFSLL